MALDISGLVSKTKFVAERSKLILDKNSPAILVGAGIAGFVASTVLAARSTLKVGEVIDRFETRKETLKDTDGLIAEGLTEQQINVAKADNYFRLIGGFVQLYGPSIALTVASAACILKGHSILNKRNAALAAAYKLVDETFKQYRKEVIDRYGESVDADIRAGGNVIETRKEDGTVEKSVVVSEGGKQISMYGRCFDESNINWTKTPGYNFMFLHAQQAYANQLLQSRGHVFLNEIYDALGFDRTPEGALVGWFKGNGDDIIDFGIVRIDRPENLDFIEGFERSVWLDFNVDGVIWDKL